MRLDLREDLPDGDVGHHRELCELVCARRTALRQVGRPDLEAGPDHARNERMAVAVDDVPALRVDLNRPHAVLARLGAVLRSCEHLERPEPQEQHGEDCEGDEPEDRDAERKLRRQPIGLLDPRVGGQEAARSRVATQGASRRARGRRRRQAGTPFASGCRRATSAPGSGGRSPVAPRGRHRPARLPEHGVQGERAEGVNGGRANPRKVRKQARAVVSPYGRSRTSPG